MSWMENKSARRLLMFVFAFVGASYLYVVNPKPIHMAALTTASTTLGESRLSYKAGISGTPGIGATAITIDNSGNPDNDTDHLFINDDICFSNAVEGGCIGNTEYNVQAIDDVTDGLIFSINPALANALAATDTAIATQAGSMVISFVTSTEIPSDGNILITIPAVDHATKPCDGMPDHAASVATNGFDLGDSDGTAAQRVGVADISVTGCTDGNWVATETITCGTASTDHTIEITRQTTACAASSTITITIDNTPGIINPAPVTSGHTQGTSDVYTINATTRNGSDVTLDSVDMKIAPIEAVQVSATVDETLSFIISGVAAATTACGQSTDVTTTATQVPFGTLAAVNTFYDAANDLDVSTNADGGYSVTVSANDQLGRNGGACSGDAGISSNCIPDTVCDEGSCSHLAAAVDDWETASNNGFGYSLEATAGIDAEWEWDSNATASCNNDIALDFCAAQFADEEQPQSAVEIMSNANPVNSNNIYVCYRINVGGTQPAGTYYNRLRYTATATF